MLYLSQLELPLSRKLYNPYDLHQLIWKAFKQNGEDSPRDFLYRVDKTNHYKILVQSETSPCWEFLEPNEYKVKEFNPVFKEGQTFFFFLRANAVKAERVPGKKNSNKIPLRPKEYLDFPLVNPDTDEVKIQPGWLKRQAEKNGFKIISASRTGETKAKTYSKKEITLTGQNLEGYLTVIDSALFEKIYRNGLGRGKGFGFGLLSLRKP